MNFLPAEKPSIHSIKMEKIPKGISIYLGMNNHPITYPKPLSVIIPARKEPKNNTKAFKYIHKNNKATIELLSRVFL